MGPLALADLVGLDTTKAILETLERELRRRQVRAESDARQSSSPQGKLGRKTGAGFYDYGK